MAGVFATATFATAAAGPPIAALLPTLSLALSLGVPGVAGGAYAELPESSLDLSSPPAVVRAVSARVDAPTLTLSGVHHAPTIAAGARVALPESSLDLSSPALTILAGTRADLPALHLLSEALPVAIRAGSRVNVPALTLTGVHHAPAIAAGARVAPPESSLDLSSPALTILAGARADLPVTDLDLSQPAPLIATGTRVDLPALHLSYSVRPLVVLAGKFVYLEHSRGYATTRGATGLHPTGVTATTAGPIERMVREGLPVSMRLPPPIVAAGARVDLPLLALVDLSIPSAPAAAEIRARSRRVHVQAIAS